MPSSRNAGALKCRILVVMSAVALVMALFAASAQAGTITVTNTGDGTGVCPSASECTLRKAVETAAAGETISLPAGNYILGSEVEVDEKDLTIAGAGQSATTLTTSASSRLLYVEYAELTLSGITLKKGMAPESKPEGGAVYLYYGALKVNQCTFTEDTASHGKVSGSDEYGGEGGAIYNDYGKLSISASTFTNDIAEGGNSTTVEYDEGSSGGAIYSDGSLKIASSTFTGDKANGGSSTSASKDNGGGTGGAIYSESQLSITGSTFSGNVAGGGNTAESGKKGGYSGEGGALYSDGQATIATSTFNGENVAGAGANGSGTAYGEGGYGGGIYNDESLVLSNSVISGNVAASSHNGGYAGGIYNDGTTSIIQSTISDNQAMNGDGGGIYNDYLELELVGSTVAGNKAAYGAGIYNTDPMSATNSTIAENTASYEGGGIYNDDVATLASVTLFGNTAEEAKGGGNLYLDYYDLSLHDTLIAAGKSPTSGGNCAFDGSDGTIVSNGYNAEDSNQCQLDGPGDQVNVPLNLAPLGSYGGPTQTVALLAGSAAIDKGDPAGCTSTEGELLTTDQRGVARPQNGRCDVGAFEYVFPVPTPAPKPTPSAPKDSGLAINPRSFAPSSNSASIAKRHKHKVPVGAEVIYKDSEAATTTFTVVLLQHGHRVHGLCTVRAKHGKKFKHGKACTKETTIKGSFTHVDVAGYNHFEFTGHIGGHKLAKGTYVLIAKPQLGTLSGARASAVFEIS
jgi:hypothetical protein